MVTVDAIKRYRDKDPSMALSYTKIEFAQLQHAFSRAYKARDTQAIGVLGARIHALMIAIACGGVAL